MVEVLKATRPELIPFIDQFSNNHEYRAKDWVGQIAVETLIIASRQDEIIPFSRSLSLREYFNSRVTFKSFGRSSHQEIMHSNQNALAEVQDLFLSASDGQTLKFIPALCEEDT